MLCEVSAQSNKLQAVLVRGGVRTILESTDWTGSYSSAVTIAADLFPSWGGSFSFPITCSVSGGGVAAKSIRTENDVMPAGRIGIFNNYLDEATYSSFVVNHPYRPRDSEDRVFRGVVLARLDRQSLTPSERSEHWLSCALSA